MTHVGFIYPDQPDDMAMRDPNPALDYLTPVEEKFPGLPALIDPWEDIAIEN